MSANFLTAEWRKLILVNYRVSPEILKKYLPKHTELDGWNDTFYVSLVGFMFLHTRIKGMAIPFHIHFEEVNLRFYVKHRDEQGEWKRGVVFIKEIVPRWAISWVANTLYKEHYQTLPMRHVWEQNGGWKINYQWKFKNNWQLLEVMAGQQPQAILNESEEEFITEHFWGYTKISENKTSEYQVTHPAWEVYPVKSYQIEVDFAGLYGKEFLELAKQPPLSVFLAEGSEISVKAGKVLMDR